MHAVRQSRRPPPPGWVSARPRRGQREQGAGALSLQESTGHTLNARHAPQRAPGEQGELN
eukprot:2816208-Heterocapsa_arctica.AAC.1